jgi:hypothetical protein
VLASDWKSDIPAFFNQKVCNAQISIFGAL